jgi:hypothetical protein
MNKYSQIIPATDWYFRHDPSTPGGMPVFYHVAAWALRISCTTFSSVIRSEKMAS